MNISFTKSFSKSVRTLVRWTARIVALIVLMGAAFYGWRVSQGNFGQIASGFYRSGQLGAAQLGTRIDTSNIATVLNLRGYHPDQPWYRDERDVTLDADATQIDMALSSELWLTRPQLRWLISVLDRAERPLLIHCQHGSERTGLVASIVWLLEPGGSIDRAEDVFDPYYLYAPTRDGLVMRGLLDQYASWLNQEGLEHDPSRFRDWARDHYQPGTPSREQWPHDPYPLVVVTRPESRRPSMVIETRAEGQPLLIGGEVPGRHDDPLRR